MSDYRPSSNWFALKKQLPSKKRKLNSRQAPGPVKKPRREDNERPSSCTPSSHPSASAEPSTSKCGSQGKTQLQKMVLGQLEYSEAQKESGKYLSLDCEMVGVGIDGSESSLARISLVNYHGAVILDEFVRQKERVVDYRTQWSGIRPKDVANAQTFEVLQKQVSDLLKDKILVGHAVYNDLKALLLSHPRPMTRDTQYYAHKFGVCKSGRVALRDLVKRELGLTIQSGEHSSVTDARAAMAVYRLHQKTWEKGVPRHLPQQPPTSSELKKAAEKELHVDIDTSSDGKLKKKQGVRSGLSTVTGQTEVEMRTKRKAKHASKWWTQLPTATVGEGSIHYDAEVRDTTG